MFDVAPIPHTHQNINRKILVPPLRKESTSSSQRAHYNTQENGTNFILISKA
jgi:hypothetical protein